MTAIAQVGTAGRTPSTGVLAGVGSAGARFRARFGRGVLSVALLSVVLAPLAVLTGLSAPAGAASPPTVTASPASVSAGDPVTVTWSDIVGPTATDWVGLYTTGAAADGYDYLAYAYTSGGASGTLNLGVPTETPAGATYELRLFSNNSFSLLATSGSFTVSATSGTPASLTAGPAVVSAGSPVTASWSGIATPTGLDWVGLYPSGTTASYDYAAYAYTSGAASGTLDLVVPAGTPAGATYELRLLSNDSYSVMATSGSFTVS